MGLNLFGLVVVVHYYDQLFYYCGGCLGEWIYIFIDNVIV
jgi:hypothetical protein